MAFRDELIEIYATTPLADIRKSAKYQALGAANSGDSHFDTERNLVEKAKVWVEAFLKPPKTLAEEVKGALTLLMKVRGKEEEDRARYHDLIVAGYKNKWTAAQQEYFESAWDKLRSKYEFFLSFTTRFDVPGENPVNSSYQHFIRWVLGHEEFDKADRKKTNLLALSAYRLLKSPDWPAFLFTHSQLDNSETEKKLIESVSQCLVFVQLVQNIMLTPSPQGTNYCYFEYEQVRKCFKGDPDMGRRILFAVAENNRASLLAPERVPIDYDDWYQVILNRDPPYLPETRTSFEPARIDRLSMLFKEKLRPQINDALQRIINGVPV
jgi:hypothetical protein